jgi:hypothetical protein
MYIVSADGATSEKDAQNVSYVTAVRPLNRNVYPMGFLETVRQKQLRIEDTQTERGLLNYFTGIISDRLLNIILETMKFLYSPTPTY